ncbi:hypothetical protein V496_01551 [Pseudogymnoascus sp. VKM F-4515 (FW-2607)]|nr:hypothetical protein V496_01551 [Pseudogymnoascus sp. VKM F-4515 (FW-2607)]
MLNTSQFIVEPASMAKIHREGVTLLSESEGASEGRRDLNVIFIHGLRGHPRGTWSHIRSTSTTGGIEDTDTRTDKHNNIKTFFGLKKSKKETDDKRHTSTSPSSDIFWPEEYLAPDLPQARIWTYGYNADIIRGLFQANNQNSVSQHGRDFAVRLERDIDNEDPIVFVAHSLGGIITKDALHKSETIRKRTRLIVFLGTPHRGSTYAGWGEIASNLASLALQDSNKRLVQTLEVNGEVLDNIHEEFKTILSKCAIKVHSFQESKGISGMKGLDGKVVDNFSSKLDLAREQETVETIDANHMDMARCNSREDVCYRQICGVLKQFIRETNSANNKDSSSIAKLFIVPFSQDEHFIGREDILDQLELGGQQEASKRHTRHALVGLGGVGKSQIAIEYAYRRQKHRPQISVFWIHSSTKTRFEQGYQEMAARLELPGRDDPKANVLRLVYNWLSDEANGQWLMILDNVDDRSVFLGNNDVVVSPRDQATNSQPPLETFLPQSRNGSILITSRNSTAANNLVDTFGKLILVEPMKQKDSVDLLKTKIPVAKYSEADLKELAEALEGIPLAITHAAAYIRSNQRVTVSIYLGLFRESEANQANLMNNNETKDLRRDHSIRHAVITTWQISFDQIQRTSTEAADLLSLMCMFDRQSIPERLLHNNTDQLLFEDSIAPLVNFSLIREHSEGGAFEMHRLVQLSTRKWVELNGQLEKWRSEAIKITARLLPGGDYETWSDCQILLPHVRTVMSFKATDQQDLLRAAAINTRLGWYYMLKGEAIRAEPILKEAVVVRERELGVNHPDTLTSVSNLASVLQSQGRYEEAESMNRRALEGSERELGINHPGTLTSVSNLASVLQSQGRYEEAEPINRRALEGYARELGVNHPKTLSIISNLASVLQSQGRYDEAESMNRRALEGRERELRVNHPDTLTSVSNLASVLQSQGRYEEAELMNRRALEGSERELGINHPNTLTSVSNLASVLRSQGKYEAAESMNRRALEGSERELGVNHPNTLTSVNNLALVLQSQGRYEEAELMNRRALEGRERELGINHPNTLTSVNNLTSVLRSQGKYEAAESMNRRALEGYERELGVNHPDTLTSVSYLRLVLLMQGKYKEAEAMHRRGLEGREKVLRVEHPNTQGALSEQSDTNGSKPPPHSQESEDDMDHPEQKHKDKRAECGSSARRRPSILNMSSFWMWLAGILDPPPPGCCRISYKCGCGDNLYVDVRELLPGGIERFRQRLLDAASAVRSERQDLGNPTNHPALPPSAYLPSTQNAAGSGESQASSASNPLPELLSRRSTSAQWEQGFQYVLLCINTKRVKTLAHIEVGSFQNDQYLFSNIRETYQQIRRGNEWRFSMLTPALVKRLTQRFPVWLAFPTQFAAWADGTRVHTPRSADFIRFQLVPIRTEICPAYITKPSFPPEEEVLAQRYLYRPFPRDVEIHQVPFIHELLKPGAHLGGFWLATFPKKLHEPLVWATDQQVIGWGIQINEGLNWSVILSFIICCLVLTGLCVVLVAICRKDVSEVGGLPSCGPQHGAAGIWVITVDVRDDILSLGFPPSDGGADAARVSGQWSARVQTIRQRPFRRTQGFLTPDITDASRPRKARPSRRDAMASEKTGETDFHAPHFEKQYNASEAGVRPAEDRVSRVIRPYTSAMEATVIPRAAVRNQPTAKSPVTRPRNDQSAEPIPRYWGNVVEKRAGAKAIHPGLKKSQEHADDLDHDHAETEIVEERHGGVLLPH